MARTVRKARDMGWLGLRRGKRLGADGETTRRTASRGRSLLAVQDRQYVADAPYFLPKDDQEVNRLDFQHYLFRYALKGNYAAPLTTPSNILDVGTGTGRWAMEMAALFPQANVVGLDLIPPPADGAASALGHGLDRRPPNYVYVQGSVLDGLPFPDATFDFVHQRLLVAAIPEERWPWVVGELLRVTRPGGWVESLEAIPTRGGPGMNTLYEWLVGVGRGRGVNILATTNIPVHLQQAGAQHIFARELPMPLGNWGGHAGSMMEANYFALHQGIKARLLESGATTPEAFDRAMEAARREIARGQFVWPYFLVYGQRPLAQM
jgi:SAM-dependent methyltransferase